MSFKMGGGDEPLAPVLKEVMAETVIRQSRQLLASEAFRKKATPDEIREIERTLLEAEATLARYDQQRKARGAPSMGGVAMTGTLDPVAAIGALVIVLVGVAFISQSPGAKQAGEALDEALSRVSDRISEIAGRASAAAVATATAMQASALDTLGKILGKSPGQLVPFTKAALDAIRAGIAVLLASGPPPKCENLHNDYKTKLARANTSLYGGAARIKSEALWNEFVTSALALARCLTGSGGPPSGPAPA